MTKRFISKLKLVRNFGETVRFVSLLFSRKGGGRVKAWIGCLPILFLLLFFPPVSRAESSVVTQEKPDKYVKYLILRKDEVKALQMNGFFSYGGFDYIGTPEALKKKTFYVGIDIFQCALAVGTFFIDDPKVGLSIAVGNLIVALSVKAEVKNEIRNLVKDYNEKLRKKLGINIDSKINLNQ